MARQKAARIGRTALLVMEWIGVVLVALLLIAGLAVAALLWWPYAAPVKLGATAEGAAPSAEAAPKKDPALEKSGAPSNGAGNASLFSPIAQVLQSPRCMNCHPAGDRPLWRNGEEHPMNLSRTSFNAGLACQTCHQQSNADERLKQRGGPPGAPHWQLPPRETPMVFQGLDETTLCRNLRDRRHNGERSADDLIHHVMVDPLVLWGFNPGEGRSKPPLTHAAFVDALKAWVDADTPCPGDEPQSLESPPPR